MKEEVNRRKVRIAPDAVVVYNKEHYRIDYILDMNEVIGIHLKTGVATKLKTSHITSPHESIDTIPLTQKDISLIGEDDWDTVKKRLFGIEPILKGGSLEEIERRANEVGVSVATLYRWFKGYNDFGSSAGLLPRKRGRKAGERMIDIASEYVINQVIDSFYLTPQKPKVQAVIRKVHSECLKKGIPLPGKNTIRNRITKIDNKTRVSARQDKKIARDMFDPVPGHFEAPYPLHTVQIDHTKMDIMIVSEEDREPIGRPWLTLAIDIHSRMIHGYYLSLEAPSATSVAMCIANAILPKDTLLLEYDIEGTWDIWGFMDNVHVDNGADFRSETLKRACILHHINIDYRPLGKTNYGGHIERVIGTVMAETHLTPGTTFSSVKDKGSYDPEKHAVMTFSELEKWLISFFVKIYHKRIHHSIGMSPEEKFMEGILHADTAGLPAKPENPQSIYLDFLPSFHRTIQRNGVNIEGLHYFDAVLRPYIHASDESGKKKKQFAFKRDPKNVAEIWFFNETDGTYYRIPEASQSMGHMTLFELNQLKRKVQQKREQSGRRVSHESILSAYEELNTHIESSKKKTKKARREKARKSVSKRQHEQVLPPQRNPLATPTQEDDSLWDNLDDLPDFDVE